MGSLCSRQEQSSELSNAEERVKIEYRNVEVSEHFEFLDTLTEQNYYLKITKAGQVEEVAAYRILKRAKEPLPYVIKATKLLEQTGRTFIFVPKLEQVNADNYSNWGSLLLNLDFFFKNEQAHNDISINNVGVTPDGNFELFDLDCSEKFGHEFNNKVGGVFLSRKCSKAKDILSAYVLLAGILKKYTKQKSMEIVRIVHNEFNQYNWVQDLETAFNSTDIERIDEAGFERFYQKVKTKTLELLKVSRPGAAK